MIISEIGWNFLGDIDLAKKMIDAAKNAGCNYVKFQLWNPKNLKSGTWDNDGRREIYNKSYLDEKKYLELYNYCESKNINCFASVFNDEGFKILLKYPKKFIKIPSLEAYDLELIQRSLDNFENVLVSTGALKHDDLNKLEKFNNYKNLTILHCVSSYPLEHKDCNFSKFFYLKKKFRKVGYSGHCAGIEDAIFALSNGAVAIEKHFTIDNSLPGRDNKFAILESDLKFICDYQLKIEEMLIDKGLELQESEIDAYENYRGRWKA
jgi:N,N'-diacetyllegionaminate synthase